MQLEYFDSHVHLDANDFDPDREEVIERALLAGVSRFVTIGAGYGIDSASRAIALAEKHPFIWASAGIHPHDASFPLNKELLLKSANHSRVVAIGETGLDFHYDLAPRDMQDAWFRLQIEIALELKKPLIIHCRLAAKECLSTLIDMQAHLVGGVFHCYSEDSNFAKELQKINFMVSFPGIVTFKKSDAMRAALRNIPLEQIMIETDAPYLAPVPYRGKRCESSFLPKTAETIAQEKGLSIEEVANATFNNAMRFYRIEKK